MIESHNKIHKRKIAKTISLLIDDRNEVPEFIQFFLVDRLLWAATEYDDNEKFNKYFGVPFWSSGAITKVIDNIENSIKYDKDLVHEHSVPKCIIGKKMDELYEKKLTSEDHIFNLIDRFCHSVVVSKDEDVKLNKAGLRSKMPQSFAFATGDDVFGRYRAAGIEVFCMESADLSHLSKGKIPDGGITRKKIC